ncbi:3-deoxy-D-manno-octulosonic acid transferase [Psychromonas sp. RZ22]|uniref:lipid IV(A) 3-deoxy-D-manno-octulosonic acid transferase n=1 Tax=Psychromonas algarum TaxID=2555643 RepID=UPI0010683ACD|nr:lipid IV(A) 3-deoxy-D-manno-octulosonic acid transferase [Psychromonas sp. RZ22]TEW56618.1 3-deoxy-D-manno-octulosonic acid transferase [Psychromonas sp. RZ22]
MILRWLYSLLLLIVAPFFIYSLYKSKPNKPKFGKRWKEHFGFTPTLDNPSKYVVWFHTVSVGETIAATPLIRAYHHSHPEHTIVITTTTSTGAEQAAKLSNIAQHRYMPVDFSFAIKRFIRTIKPQKIFIMETELWPNTLAVAAQNNVEITILNARLSARSCLRYKKFQRIFNLLSQNIQQVLCQTKDDAERFLSLGLNDQKVKITGSLKFDINISSEVISAGLSLRKEIAKDRPVWIVASTHLGEDEIVLEAHKSLLKEIPKLVLIIVPRHPERFEQVYQLSQQQGFKSVRKTSKQPVNQDIQVFIGDTMGEMLMLIGAADICFMAGSLVGEKVGGHNLLEPAALAKPCLTGPSYYNFKQITEQLIAANGCTICNNSDEIYQAVKKLINDPNLQKQSGTAALSIVNENKGSLQKTLSYLL